MVNFHNISKYIMYSFNWNYGRYSREINLISAVNLNKWRHLMTYVWANHSIILKILFYTILNPTIYLTNLRIF